MGAAAADHRACAADGDVTAIDEQGHPLPVADGEAQLEIPAGGEAAAVKFDLPLRLPSRDVRRIASLKGKLLAMIPGKIETFRFDKLAGRRTSSSGSPASL